MASFHECVQEYKKQLQHGTIRDAYRGLMEYIMFLRRHFNTKYPDYFVSGNIYFGYMDMTYFSFTPASLKNRKLKIAVVFIHELTRFEVWLGGYNKQVQSEYWNLFKQRDWKSYHLVPTTKGVDSILEYILTESPDFNDLSALTNQIESETLGFIKDVEGFLDKVR